MSSGFILYAKPSFKVKNWGKAYAIPIQQNGPLPHLAREFLSS
jgi:hypothetical protein